LLFNIKPCLQQQKVNRSGQVAQLVEQRTENPRVGGSTPSLATKHFFDPRQRELLDQLDALPLEKQRQLLDFARSLAQPKGRPGNEVLLFGRAIDAEDLSAMAAAIEDGCEQVNADQKVEWAEHDYH
jgi:hypothetical protein